MKTTDYEHERLAAALRDRAEELGLSQHAISEETKRLDPRGKGLSLRTVSGLFNVGEGMPSPRTRGLIEQALQWPAGAIKQVLEGSDPPPPATRDTAVRVAELADEVADLRRIIRQMAETLTKAIDVPPDRRDV